MAEFEPPSYWTRDIDLAHHEAGHAVIALWHDVEVLETRIDRPDVGADGRTRFRKIDFAKASRDELKAQLAATLGGPLANNQRMTWPLSGYDTTDEGWAKTFVFLLDYSRDEFEQVQSTTAGILQFLQSDVRALAAALLDRGAIPGSEIKQVIKEYRAKQVKA